MEQKPGKVSGTERKQMKERFATNYVNWQQTNNTTGYKKSIF